jgi:tRNA threonylcarbamoyl adenosine modification protein YeaZ
MIGLAIHTSSPELGLALIDLDRQQTRSQVWPLGRDLTAYLHTCLAEFITPHAWQELTYITVARGPGGFTGTRIGVVVARTLAQQLNIPLFGISSLDAIAQYYQQHLIDRAIHPPHFAVSLRAQRGEVFGAIYQLHGPDVQVVVPDALYSQADWDTKLSAWPTPLHRMMAEGGLANSVEGVLTLAHTQWQRGDRPAWSTVLPFYGQHPVQ